MNSFFKKEEQKELQAVKIKNSIVDDDDDYGQHGMNYSAIYIQKQRYMKIIQPLNM